MLVSRNLIFALLFSAVTFWKSPDLRAQEAGSESQGGQSFSLVELEQLLNREGTDLQFGDVTIPKGSERKGPLVVIDGLVFVSGLVQGDLTVVNGSVSLQREAVITGDLTIIGGVCYASQQANVRGQRRILPGRYQIMGSASGRLRLQEERPRPSP